MFQNEQVLYIQLTAYTTWFTHQNTWFSTCMFYTTTSSNIISQQVEAEEREVMSIESPIQSKIIRKTF